MALYRRCDLDYDLKDGRIRIQVPTAASGALSPEDAAILHWHSVCAMAVQAATQVDEADEDEEVHDSERSTADIMAQKNLNPVEAVLVTKRSKLLLRRSGRTPKEMSDCMACMGTRRWHEACMSRADRPTLLDKSIENR